jgi:hypothetical protein
MIIDFLIFLKGSSKSVIISIISKGDAKIVLWSIYQNI